MAKKYVGYSFRVRVRSKYRKQKHHSKKIKSQKDLNRDAWREEKQILRDKAKRFGIVKGCFSDGVPPWLKRQCNKTYRRWERRCVRNGEFDKLLIKGKRRDFFDPWMWF